MSLHAVKTGTSPEDERVRQGRIDLAAAFRMAARYGWNEAVANHFSLAVSDDGRRFLMNPQGRHWARMTASDILELDTDEGAGAIGSGAGKADPTAWHIHSRIHAMMPEARCVLHTHMVYATTLACLKDYRLQMIDQNAMRFYNRIAYDDDFNGMALDGQEGGRICSAMKGKSVMFMANHGVAVVAGSVAEAFDEMYYLERACQVQVMALQTGRPLCVVSDSIAELTCRQWHEYPADAAHDHFNELKRILDREEPEYAS